MPEFSTNEIPVRDNMKDHIASVAEALLTKYSLAAISVKMIITAAGTSRTTFYRYFKDKHDVILWIYMKEAQQLIKECDTFSMLALKCCQFMNERRTVLCGSAAMLQNGRKRWIMTRKSI